jgi:hypothetical protein
VFGLVSTNKTRILREVWLSMTSCGFVLKKLKYGVRIRKLFYLQIKWLHQIPFTDAASDTRSPERICSHLLCSVYVKCLNRGIKRVNRKLNYRLSHLYHHLSSYTSHSFRSGRHTLLSIRFLICSSHCLNVRLRSLKIYESVSLESN